MLVRDVMRSTCAALALGVSAQQSRSGRAEVQNSLSKYPGAFHVISAQRRMHARARFRVRHIRISRAAGCARRTIMHGALLYRNRGQAGRFSV